jgi:hypothetical protein
MSVVRRFAASGLEEAAGPVGRDGDRSDRQAGQEKTGEATAGSQTPVPGVPVPRGSAVA